MTDTERAIEDLQARLDAIQVELDRMPEHKRGSEWHLDRQEVMDAIDHQIRRLTEK